jgi:NADPH-dependent curcumin reductase CurA
MTFQELRARAQLLQLGIVRRENMVAQLSNQRTGISDGDYVHQMQTWTAEVKGHKELLTKVHQAMSQAAPQQSMLNLNPSLFRQTSMANLYVRQGVF